LLPLAGDQDEILSVAYSNDGQRIVGGCADHSLRVWDSANGEEILRLQGHRGPVASAAFSPDGRRIVSGSEDTTLKVWDAASGYETLTLRGHADRVNSVAFSPDGRRIVSGSADDTLKLWDAFDSDPAMILTSRERISGGAFTSDGQRLIGVVEGCLTTWDLASGREVARVAGDIDGHCWALSPDGRRIASGSDGRIKVSDAGSGEELLICRGHEEGVWSVAFSRDGSQIVSGSYDKTARVWDAASGDQLLTLSGHTGCVEGVGFTPDGKRIGSQSYNETLVWDAQSGKRILAIEHSRGFSFSADGRRIAVPERSNPDSVNVWDIETGGPVLTLSVQQHNADIRDVAYSPDGRWIGCALAAFGALPIWRASDGRQVVTLRLPPDRNRDNLEQLAFSPDSKRIAAFAGNTVTIWDLSRFIEDL
jgi:WD40 repeat protein